MQFDALKCVNNPCDPCPIQALKDPTEKNRAGYTVAGIIDDPLFGTLLETANVQEVDGMAIEITQRICIADVLTPVTTALVLKVAGVCETTFLTKGN